MLSLLALLSFVLSSKLIRIPRFDFRYALGMFVLVNIHNYGLLMLIAGLSFCVTVRMIESGASVSKGFGANPYRHIFFPFLGVVFLSIPLWYIFLNTPIVKSMDGSTFQYAGLTVRSYVHEWIKPGIKGLSQVIALYYGFKPFRILLLTTAVIGTFYFLVKKKWAAILFPVAWVAGPTGAIYFADLYLGYWFIQRQFLWVMPFWAVYNAVCFIVCLGLIKQLVGRLSHSLSA